MIYHVGDYCVTLIGDEVAATRFSEPLTEDESQWAVPPHEVKGLGKHVRKGVAVVLVTLDDMDIINFVQKGHRYGYGYSLNVQEPAFSEWGDTGIIR